MRGDHRSEKKELKVVSWVIPSACLPDLYGAYVMDAGIFSEDKKGIADEPMGAAEDLAVGKLCKSLGESRFSYANQKQCSAHRVLCPIHVDSGIDDRFRSHPLSSSVQQDCVDIHFDWADDFSWNDYISSRDASEKDAFGLWSYWPDSHVYCGRTSFRGVRDAGILRWNSA